MRPLALLALALIAAPALAASPRLAVLELRHTAPLTAAEADYLTDLVRGVAGDRGDLLVLTRENIVELLPPGTALAACEGDCEVETGRRLGVDFVVSGEVVGFGGELRVMLRLHATRSGALIATERAGAPHVAGLERPVELAARALLARTGAGGPDPANAPPRPPPVAYGRIGVQSGPRLPPALFLLREPMTADRAAWAKLDAELARLAAEQPERSAERAALRARRGLLAWRFAAAEQIRAFEAEDACLAAAADLAARTACAAARAERELAARPALATAAAALADATDAEPLLARADAHRGLGDRPAARAAIDALGTRHPDSPQLADGRLLLGVMFFDEGRDDFAEGALTTLAGEHAGAAAAPYARYLLGWTALRRGRAPQAVSWMKRVLADTARARADHPADRAEALLRREARADLVRAWSARPRASLDAAFALFAEVDPPGALRLPEALAELYTAGGRRADARAVLDRLRGALAPRCQGGDAHACGELERLCARHGGAACP